MKNSSMIPETQIEKIVGSWNLISIYYLFDDGTKMDLYGKKPIGILMYDENGFMNAQLGDNLRQEIFRADDLADPTAKSKIFDSYMAYYGTYYEEAPGKVIHEVIGCTNPTWIGKKEIRYVDIHGDTLRIWTLPTLVDRREAVIEVYWQRIH
ncbi:MAG: lipocalin-like domain-containing protein [Breznakibacter sp.]